MSTTGLIISLVILAFGLAWIASPLLGRARRKGASTLERDELLTRYERVLSAIRDLDEDYQTGKLNAEAYQEERSVWAQRGVLVLQRLEEQGGLPRAGADFRPAAAADTSHVDDELEAAVARYVQSKAAL
ncbi:MAG: hypothetical protein MUE40_05310 [Anaerolineae bacterium]|jgi:hypothetical protein|nr:hypothetical protein [Anaerolineae bacterium]